AWQSSDDSTKAISVSVRTLDSLSTEKRIGPARLIVTDLEGEEVNFLHGARQYIGEHRPYLLMEAAPPLLKLRGQSIDGFYAFLFGLHYEVFGLTRFGLAWIGDPQNIPDRQNWFCVPREHNGIEDKVRRILLRCGLAPLVLNLNPLKLRGLS
ncbi:MAG TPA: FkbM family methyltransferase, partial [Pyrinomonadaceae bacterium]|nr:FkbM family methyltransferase [Pyrinomonadaceae bacterium]